MSENDQVTALNLPPLSPLPEKTQKYFDICQEKLGIVPNVLLAHAFNIDKLNAFTALYNETMLADSGISKLEREMIAVVVYAVNKGFYCLTAHGQAVRVNILLTSNNIVAVLIKCTYWTSSEAWFQTVLKTSQKLF